MRADRVRVERAMCNCANPCKKYLNKAAGKTNIPIRLKLGGPIATIDWQVRLE